MRSALTAAVCLTPLCRVDDPLLIIEDGIIDYVGRRREVELPAGTRMLDFPGAVLAPGFVDIHVHGGAGHDDMSADRDGLADFERHLARHGTTAYFPTTVTAPVQDTCAALDRLADAIEETERNHSNQVRAKPSGIHLEGPFLSHEKRGVHPAEHLQAPSTTLFERFWQAARGHIKWMTMAPELPGALELISEASRRGVCVALGHSNADYASARAGIAAGARHATHTFNAMRAMDHRDPGIVGAVLTEASLSAEIIADGVHVAPVMVDIFLRAKGRDSALLVTDAISATGMGDGRYRLGTFEVEVRGEICRSAEGKLAGSVLTLDRAVRNIMDFAGCDLQDAVRFATANPARVAGLDQRKGVLAPGADADIVVLSSAGEVLRTIVGADSIVD
jgi:N-acetylglucosamine-6-phosphate deacetylase